MTAPKGFLPYTPGKFGNRICIPNKMGIRCGSSGNLSCACDVSFYGSCFAVKRISWFLLFVIFNAIGFTPVVPKILMQAGQYVNLCSVAGYGYKVSGVPPQADQVSGT
jgi:hypothetical protein